jgi:hypothetical protein
MTEGVVVERDATRVLNGVNVWGYPTGCSSLWEPCSGGTYRVKDDESEQPNVRFDAFVVYKPVTCSSIGLRDPEELFVRAQAVLDATASAAVEKMLAQGIFESSNPFFGDTNVDDLTTGTAVSAGVGLSMLEEAIGATCRMGMLHFTPAVVAALQAFPFNDTTDVRLITANGTPIVSGMGYQGVDTQYLPDASTGEDYGFATGPPRVYLGPVRLDQVRDNLDRSDNVLTFRAEMYVLAIWDTALQAAALIDWTT